MFTDELYSVLETVPYKVWGKVIQAKVDRVSVVKKYRSMSGMNSRPQIVVYIHSGFDNYKIEGLDSIDERNETLLRTWKPYRDLVLREIDEYRRALEAPSEFMLPEYTEEEIEDRIDNIIDSARRDSQYIFYIRYLGLTNLIKKAFRNSGHLASTEDIKDTVLGIIYKMVVAVWSKTKPEEVFSEYDIPVTDEKIICLHKLVKYCRDIFGNQWNEDDLREFLDKFLNQYRNIREIYEIADDLVEDVLNAFSEWEQKCIRTLEFDDFLKKQVLKLDEKFLGDRFNNLFTIGYMEGYFYSYMDKLFISYLKEPDRDIEMPAVLKDEPYAMKMWNVLKLSAQKYKDFHMLSLEDVDQDIRITKSGDDEHFLYTGELSKYDIFVIGADIDDVRKKLKKEFEWKQTKERIREALIFGRDV